MSTMTFLGLFGGAKPVTAISIPLIQRDYAQGRTTDDVPRILDRFLDSLRTALTCDEPAMLDFIYGDRVDGCFVPLDGQQRLTTLFLLHWYVAARAGQPLGLGRDAFRYETRISARTFCAQVIDHLAEWPGSPSPQAWIADQAWFARSWSADPTIASMLAVLDAIHLKFGRDDAAMLWSALREESRIQFHVLWPDQFQFQEDLYVKMNARGLRLTPFETFKGPFAKVLKERDEAVAAEFELRADNAWADLLWPYRDAEDLVDSRMMAYLRFITEVAARHDGIDEPGGVDLADWSEAVFGGTDADACARRSFLLDAFNCWCPDQARLVDNLHRPQAVMDDLFALNGHVPGKVTLWSSTKSLDLFERCVEEYTTTPFGDRGGQRKFSLKDALILYAVVIHRIENTTHFGERLRQLRNLLEHSQADRLENFGPLLRRVRLLIGGGLDALDGGKPIHARQLAEEIRKRAIRAERPELAAVLDELEDQPQVRGCLAAFDLDDLSQLAVRARAFIAMTASDGIRKQLAKALLATGNYATALTKSKGEVRFQLCVAELPKSLDDLLTGQQVEAMRGVMLALLDRVGPTPTADALAAIVDDFLRATAERKELEWRWYMLHYPVMGPVSGWGHSGVYAGDESGLGFTLRRLRTTYTGGYYRDVFLVAVVQADKAFKGKTHGEYWHDSEDPWHSGDAPERWLTVKASGARLCLLSDRIRLAPPTDKRFGPAFAAAVAALGAASDDDGPFIAIPQVVRDHVVFDTEDRVQLGVRALRALLEMQARA